MRRLTLPLFLCAAALPAQAQDFVYPQQGQCPATHMEFQGVCINGKALEQRDSSNLFKQLMEFKRTHSPPPGSQGAVRACLTHVNEDKSDILKLENGAIVEVTSGYLGYVGYRPPALLHSQGALWTIAIEGKDALPVDLLRAPTNCDTPSAYEIEAASKDSVFIVNGEKFDAKTYCLGWSEGETVVFLDGSAYGACASATLFNINRADTCALWCH